MADVKREPAGLLVLTGVEDEAGPLGKALQAEACPEPGEGRFRRATREGVEIVLGVAGVGPQRSERIAREGIERFQPTLLISAGTCGALQSELELGDWVLAGATVDLARDRSARGSFSSPAALEPIAARLGAEARALRRGLVATVSGRPVQEAADKEAIVAQHGAIAVDMESAGIARAAEAAGLPWLIVRVVVDTPAAPLPDLGFDPSGRPPLGGVMAYLLKHPLDGARTLHGIWRSLQDYAVELARLLPAFSLD